MMGAVRLVVTSVAMAASEEVDGSAKDWEDMMPALRKTVSIVGKDLVISEILAGRVSKSVMSN
jgi:hypothetical protein